MDERSQQFSVVLHKLKNPLLAIERLSDILLEKESLSDNARRKLKLIRSSAEEASEYLEELDLSANSAIPDDFSSEPVDVASLARWVVESFQTHAEYKNQDLRCETSSEECVVNGDAVRLREAMNNLVSNALKYSPHGETVEVRVKRSGDTVRFSVSDNGPGLSESDEKRLFEPFQRLTPQPTDNEASSGLGLYIVKGIVDHHNGEIDVETSEDGGSTFTLIFPLASQPSSNGESSRSDATIEVSTP